MELKARQLPEQDTEKDEVDYSRNIHIITYISVFPAKLLSKPESWWLLPFILWSSKDNNTMHQGINNFRIYS